MHRFIVLSHPRSGSTLLIKALAAHSQIRMFGELFNDEEDDRRHAVASGGWRDRGRAPVPPYRTGQDAADFLDRVIFRDAAGLLAVGFKIFYRQARQEGEIAKSWNYLTHERSIRVVHLRRRNLLESLVSLRVALLTNQWARYVGECGPAAPAGLIHLTPAECEAYFNELSADRCWAEGAFRGHEIFDVEYEADLVAHFAPTLHAIHDFLGVPHGPADKLLEKQARGSLSERIANFEELARAFRGTEHELHFQHETP